MTTQAKLSTKGFEEYLEAIVRAGRDIDAIAADAVLAAAEVLEAGMRARVKVLTGNLRDHIQTKGPIIEGNFTYVEVGVIHDKAFTDADTARYGNALEYGKAHTPAQPYIRPAIAEDSGKARRAMREVLEEAAVL
jgi:HK97 gp10 family phage protein